MVSPTDAEKLAVAGLDLPRLAAALPELTVQHYAVLPSTQDRAREAAAHPLTALPLLVIADRQTAGRGRDRNSWWTGAGSLAFSLLIDPASLGLPQKPTPRLALAISVGIVEALAPRLAAGGCDEPLGLHWPNDVYAGERKVAGVLVEVLPDGRHIIGVGLNVNNQVAGAPPEIRHRVGTLRDLTGQPQDLTGVLADVLTQLLSRLRDLNGDGEELGGRFHELCLQRGRQLTLHIGERTVSGQCITIARDGALVLETAAGSSALYCGTLHKSE